MDQRLHVANLTIAIPGRLLIDNVSFSAAPGEYVAITGPSGSGKTSLLNCLAGIALPQTGTITIDNFEITALDESRRADYRLRSIGMVFQFGELLPELTVLENVALPLRFAGETRERANERAARTLGSLGMADKRDRHPDVLSGGETQRVGIARALAPQPSLVLADEPTGMLDEVNARAVTELLKGIGRDYGATVIVATHDPHVAAAADRTLRLREGRLLSGTRPEVAA